MLEFDISGKEASAYSADCEIVHLNDRNYHSHKQKKSSNHILSSFITSIEDEIRPRGLGIKYSAEGLETYWSQNKRYQVSKGKYLLVNETLPSLDVAIQNQPTWSVCIDMDAALVNDMLLQLLQPNDPDSYQNASRYLLSPELLVREATAGKKLQAHLNYIISSSAAQTIDKPAIELIYDLISLLMEENIEVISSYYKLEATKPSTRKELFNRLLLGKEMLDDSLFSELSIKQVAETCCLSEFRFYRLFKQCFGDSPYNYLFKKRIEKSIELKKQGHNWSDIASQLNFTDLAAFSKSFKKLKGVSPTKAIL